MTGTIKSDVLDGRGGDDTLIGGLGDDIYILDVEGNVTVTEEADAGTDTVTTVLGTFILNFPNVENLTFMDDENGTPHGGGQGFGDAFANVITGASGDDTLFGEAGQDTLNGGLGNDTLVGHAAAEVFSNVQDTLNGGFGNDTIQADASDIINGGDGFDVVTVINANDFSIDLGATSIEYIVTDFGNDTINGATLPTGFEAYTDGSNDTITGSAFNDRVFAGSGDDTVIGGDGNDIIVADTGIDNIQGGDGDDIIYADNGDTVSGGNGRDALFITDGGTPGGVNVGVVATGFEFVIDVTVDGGNDIIDASGTSSGIEVYAQGGTDTVTGGSGGDFLWGGTGNDTIAGNDGDDTLVGEAGQDTLTGGAGVDNLYGNSGGGGDGVLDTYVFDDGWGTDFIFDWDDGIDQIDMQAVDSLTDFAQLTITDDGPHAHIRFGANLISVAGAAGQIDASDFNL
jgi:Ca2+-binding RTX toxin-like protein